MAEDFLSKLKSSVNRGVTTISVKTSSSLEKTKIKTHIESLTKDIEKTYSVIGEAAFKIYDLGSTDFSMLYDHFKMIQQKNAEIDALSAQLSAIDERDNQILGNSSEAPAQTSGSSAVFTCNGCGAKYDSPVKFFRKCGNKMGD